MSEIKAIKGTVLECEYINGLNTEQHVIIRLDSGEEQSLKLWSNADFFEMDFYVEGDSVTCLIDNNHIIGMRRN